MGVSNISWFEPSATGANSMFLHLAREAGMDAAIGAGKFLLSPIDKRHQEVCR